MLILVGHVKQFGLSPQANGKTLKDFKLWSHMVIFALNISPQGTDKKGVGSDQSKCWQMVGFRGDEEW